MFTHVSIFMTYDGTVVNNEGRKEFKIRKMPTFTLTTRIVGKVIFNFSKHKAANLTPPY